MESRSTQTFDIRYPVALGAGLATALLLLASRQATLPAMLMAYLTPLPVMIATLGFGAIAGFASAFISAATIFVYEAARPGDFWTARLIAATVIAGLFALTLALPSWWMARLARLARIDRAAAEIERRIAPGLGLFRRSCVWRDSARLAVGKGEPRTDYPIGRIIAFAALFAIAVITGLIVTAVVLDEGSFDTLIDGVAAQFAPFLFEIVGTRELPAGMDLQELSRFYVRLMPPVVTSLYFLVIVANLWLAGRIVQISQLLARAWPDIAQDLRLPRVFALAFVASLGLSLVSGLAGMIAICTAATLGMAFMLQGLAVIHFVTRGGKFRGALLAAVYTAAALLPFMVLPLALIGLIDAGFPLRKRKALAAPQNT